MLGGKSVTRKVTGAKKSKVGTKKATRKVAKKAVKKATQKVSKKAVKKMVKKATRKVTKKVAVHHGHRGARPGSAFMKPLKPSAALAAIVGSKPIPRTHVIKKVWAYIKKHKLQDPKHKRMIRPDATFAKVVGSKPIDMFKMAAALSKQLH